MASINLGFRVRAAGILSDHDYACFRKALSGPYQGLGISGPGLKVKGVQHLSPC